MKWFDAYTQWWLSYKDNNMYNVSPADHVKKMRKIETGESYKEDYHTIEDVAEIVIGNIRGLRSYRKPESLLCWYIAAFMLYEEEYGEYK